MTETWTVETGLNPRTNWDWEPRVEDLPIAIYFAPFKGLHPIYAECVGLYEEYAILDVPAKSETGWTDWFPEDDQTLVVVPQIFVRPQ